MDQFAVAICFQSTLGDIWSYQHHYQTQSDYFDLQRACKYVDWLGEEYN